MPARLNGNTVIEEHWNLILKLVLGLGVGNRDPRAFGLQKECRGDTGFTQANHQYAFVVHIHKIHFTTESQSHREMQYDIRSPWSTQ